jgi:hypothetical protein
MLPELKEWRGQMVKDLGVDGKVSPQGMFKSKHSKVMARIKVFKKYVKNLKNFGIN